MKPLQPLKMKSTIKSSKFKHILIIAGENFKSIKNPSAQSRAQDVT